MRSACRTQIRKVLLDSFALDRQNQGAFWPQVRPHDDELPPRFEPRWERRPSPADVLTQERPQLVLGRNSLTRHKMAGGCLTVGNDWT